MTFTDPSYLRPIYDGLLSGSLNKDNASALPLGLVGVYDEALPTINHVNERHEFLNFFSVWALLKKEMSAGFVASLLGWTEENVLDYLAQYSKWFNAPVSGKYVLFHERLRSFILQKISHAQFTACNEAIIKLGQEALESRICDEWENYALEHLSTHLLIEAMESSDGKVLRALAYNTTHWNRQIEISKGFEWSKQMLNDMMLWASKYDDDEVIECSLNKVDLYHQEQNDAPRIVALVAQNDIDTALQRIEAFGGNTKEGLQRKFILYMLCLMELTLLKSKDEPCEKEGIEKLLKHLDDNLPVDNSALNWNDFFSSYLMFQMACEWAELDLEFLRVYARTENWNHDWLLEKGPYNDIQFQVLLASARAISDVWGKSDAMKDISIELAKQGKLDEAASALQEALAIARGISDDYWESISVGAISTELAKQGKLDEAASVLQEALSIARGSINDCHKSYAMRDISTELAKQGKLDEAASVLQEALVIASGISNGWDKSSAMSSISIVLAKQDKLDEAIAIARGVSDVWDKSSAMSDISAEMAKQGKLDDAFAITRDISNDYWKSIALSGISSELAKQGKLDEAASALQEAFNCTRGISNGWDKNNALSTISTELASQDKLDEALAIAMGINNYCDKSYAMRDITTELAKQGKLDEAVSAFQEVLVISSGISNGVAKSRAMKDISTELAKKFKINEALSIAIGISDDYWKSIALSGISSELAKQGKLDEAASAMHEALNCTSGIRYIGDKNNALRAISTELAKQGKLDEATSAFQEILSIARGISDDYWKSSTLGAISTELAKQGKLNEAASALQEALAIARGISDEFWKSSTLGAISTELAKQGKLNEALAIKRDISNVWCKSNAMSAISTELAKLGMLDEAAIAMQEALSWARDLTDDKTKSRALSAISTELAKQGDWALAETTGLEIILIAERYECWKSIANVNYEKTECEIALQQGYKFQNMEPKTYFLKGIADSLTSIDCSKELILNVRSYYQNDIESMENLLEQHALHELFFSHDLKDKLERFTRTFNIQWAIDVKNSFNVNKF